MILVMALALTIIPTLTAVTGGDNSDVHAYAATNTYKMGSVTPHEGKVKLAGKYFWATDTRLYCSSSKSAKKGTVLFSGSYSKYELAYGIHIVTNGSKVFFSMLSADQSKGYLYSVNTNGENRKRIKTFDGFLLFMTFRDSKIYFINDSSIKSYNTETKEMSIVVEDFFGDVVGTMDKDRIIVGIDAFALTPGKFYNCETSEIGTFGEFVEYFYAPKGAGTTIYYMGDNDGVKGFYKQKIGEEEYELIKKIPKNWSLYDFDTKDEKKLIFRKTKEYEKGGYYIEDITKYSVNIVTGEAKKIKHEVEKYKL